MKKKCITFGNCQAGALKKYLFELSSFGEIYDFQSYANWELIKDNKLAIPIQQLKEADLVIYQPLNDVYGCYSTNKNNPESFFNLLNENCKTISFPRIHNNAIWPVFRKHADPFMYGKINNNIKDLENLIYLYNNNQIDYNFKNRLEENYKISKEKEATTDVKIVDYIYDNMRKYKMFLTHDHPTSRVCNEVAKQICSILKIDYDYEKGLTFDENIVGFVDSVYKRKDNQYPISRYMIRDLNLEYIVEEDKDADEFYRNLSIQFITLNGFSKIV
jgi:hypothetical protein